MDWSAVFRVFGESQVLLGALFIFACRVSDISIDTLRVLSLVKGRKVRAAVFGFLEAGIFISALAYMLRPPVHWVQMLGYAGGFGMGTLVGATLSEWFSSEFVLLRVFTRPHGPDIGQVLREKGFAVTTVAGEGRDGPVAVLFSVVNRKHARDALEVVQRVDEKAFVVVEPVQRPIGGFVPRFVRPNMAVRR